MLMKKLKLYLVQTGYDMDTSKHKIDNATLYRYRIMSYGIAVKIRTGLDLGGSMHLIWVEDKNWFIVDDEPVIIFMMK